MKKCNGTPCTKMNETGQGKSCAIDQALWRDIDLVERQLGTFSSLETSGDTGMQIIGLLAKDVKRLAEIVERLAK